MGLLRDPGEVVPVDPDFYMQEYCRCAMDIVYFVENYMYIVTIDEGKIRMPLYPWQKDVLKNIKHDLRYLLKVARQSGKTTIAIAFVLWFSLFHEDKYIAVVAHLFSGSKEILRRYREAYMMLPKWLQQGVVKFGKEEIELENGCIVAAFATESPNLRGKTVALLYLDEFALIKKTAADEFMKSVMPVVSSGKTARVVVTSTPNGFNHFHEMWEAAQPDPITGIKKSNYKTQEVIWTDVPGRDEEFKNQILYGDLKGDEAAWEQEFECKFRNTSSGLFKSIPFDKEFSIPTNSYFNDKLVQYEEVLDPNCIYIAGVDMSEGIGKDSCVINVLRYSPPEDKFYQVLNYNDNECSQYHVATVLKYIHEKLIPFNKIYIENNKDFGLIQVLLGEEFDLGDIVHFDTKGKRYGVKTTAQSKPNWITEFLYLINQDKIGIRSYLTQDELSKFSKVNGRYEGVDAHDDEVMSLMIMMEFVKSRDYIEYKKAGTNLIQEAKEERFNYHMDGDNTNVEDLSLKNFIENYSENHNGLPGRIKPEKENYKNVKRTIYDLDESSSTYELAKSYHDFYNM